MIIDSHTHYGELLFSLPLSLLIETLDKYHIDIAITSSINGVEVDFDQHPLDKSIQIPQLQLWNDSINELEKYQDRIKLALWVKINEEKDGSRWENFIKQHREKIVALKFHPYHNNFPFASPEVKSYLKVASKYQLPVIVHTALDDNSAVSGVARVAKEFPDVKFILAHMGLGSDNLEALNIIQTIPNVYGDSTWVKPETVVEALKTASTKFLFGTDNPINGIDTYNDPIYQFCFNELKELVTKEQYENFMYKNALRVFKLSNDK